MYKQIMNGVSKMLPFAIGGEILFGDFIVVWK